MRFVRKNSSRYIPALSIKIYNLTKSWTANTEVDKDQIPNAIVKQTAEETAVDCFIRQTLRRIPLRDRATYRGFLQSFIEGPVDYMEIGLSDRQIRYSGVPTDPGFKIDYILYEARGKWRGRLITSYKYNPYLLWGFLLRMIAYIESDRSDSQKQDFRTFVAIASGYGNSSRILRAFRKLNTALNRFVAGN